MPNAPHVPATGIAAALFAVAVACGAVLDATSGKAAPESSSNSNGSLFAPIATVLRDPRCLNCHPVDDRPRQGDDRHVHQMNIVRGVDNMGFVNARCTACHRDENNEHSGVPGAPNWHLAPLSMGWQGLDDAALCTTLLDKEKNGGKDVAALVEHMRADKLVLWGWQPGGDRKPVVTPHPEFVKQLETWQAAGAPCPTGGTGTQPGSAN